MSGKTDDLKPVYLIVSEQPLLVDQAVARLKKRVGEIADLDFNSDTFDADSADADAVIAACNTLPFASDRRLVILKNVEKLNKDGLDAFTDYCADPSPTTVLALIGAKLAKNTRLYKAVDKIGGVLERKAPSARDYPSAVQGMFSDRGRAVSLDGAELMVSSVGRDLRRLAVEIDKTVAFVGERTSVTREDVEQVVSTTAPTSVFEFTDALADRNCRRSLQLAADLIGEGESVYGLHALAVRRIRDLMAAKSVDERGDGGVAQVARALGRPDWQVKQLPRQARGFSSEGLVSALRGAAEAEQEMKTSRDARLAFERWIVRTCSD